MSVLRRCEEAAAAHLEQFMYSNVALFLQGLNKDPQDRVISRVDAEVPGYCYQHNQMLMTALLASGLSVTVCPSMVVMAMEDAVDEEFVARINISHDCLIVDKRYLVDVGFASNSLRGALLFDRDGDTDSVFVYQGDSYRFKKAPPSFCCETWPSVSIDVEWWSLLVEVEHGWLELYRFAPDVEMSPEQLEQLNTMLFLANPMTIRDDKLLIAQVTPTTRIQLVALTDRSELPSLRDLARRNSTIFLKSFPQMQMVAKDLGVSLPAKFAEVFF